MQKSQSCLHYGGCGIRKNYYEGFFLSSSTASALPAAIARTWLNGLFIPRAAKISLFYTALNWLKAHTLALQFNRHSRNMHAFLARLFHSSTYIQMPWTLTYVMCVFARPGLCKNKHNQIQATFACLLLADLYHLWSAHYHTSLQIEFVT